MSAMCLAVIILAALAVAPDSTPLVILTANEKGINLLEMDGFHTNYSSLIQTPYYVQRIIHFYSRDEIYSQELRDGIIYKSFFYHRIQEYSTPSRVTAKSSWNGLTFDWLHEKLYYCEDYWIVEYDMTSETTRYLLKKEPSPHCRDLEIDPNTRTLFTTFWNGTLSAFSLLTHSYRTYTGGKKGLYDVHSVAVDCDSQLIYVLNKLTVGNDKHYLVQMDYNDTTLTILRHDIDLYNSFGLEVFNGTVVWAEYSSSTMNRSIYSCKPSPTCNHENIKRLYNTTDHPVRQTPTERYLCSTAGCTHGCSRRTLFTTQCTCPEGLSLSTDNATCQGT